MLKRRLIAGACLLQVMSWNAPAADHAWVIGGGPFLENSQAQIEFNINWVLDFLRDSDADRVIHTYFTDGGAPFKDVVEWSRPAEDPVSLQPLARVFDAVEENGNHYRNSRVPGVDGSTSRAELLDELEHGFSALRPGDRALIVYNGHGLRGERDAGDNTLRLWNDTEVTAREFEQLLDKVDPAVPVRFLFAQCYSGGFSRLIRPGGEDVLELAPGQRCGFMAESEDREAEGCSASVKIGDYRDYTTYFFSALSGTDRMGRPVTQDVDLDHDGRLTLFDAHLYALAYGYNGDLPRATSETFLERWQPWYLRWLDTRTVPDNLYGKLSRIVAGRLGLPDTEPDLVRELHARKRSLQQEMNRALEEHDANKQRIHELQYGMQRDVGERWPGALHPYTGNHQQFMDEHLGEAQAFILAHADYPELRARQDRQMELDRVMLKIERDMTQLDKVLRLRRLARLLDQFQRHAGEAEKAWFRQLEQCERSAL